MIPMVLIFILRLMLNNIATPFLLSLVMSDKLSTKSGIQVIMEGKKIKIVEEY